MRKPMKYFTTQTLPLILLCLRMNVSDILLDVCAIQALLKCHPATSCFHLCESPEILDPTEVKA